MQLSIRPYGWHFALTHADGATEDYTLEGLDRRFNLGIRGSALEVAFLARQVAALSEATVSAYFNGALMATASPSVAHSRHS